MVGTEKPPLLENKVVRGRFKASRVAHLTTKGLLRLDFAGTVISGFLYLLVAAFLLLLVND